MALAMSRSESRCAEGASRRRLAPPSIPPSIVVGEAVFCWEAESSSESAVRSRTLPGVSVVAWALSESVVLVSRCVAFSGLWVPVVNTDVPIVGSWFTGSSESLETAQTVVDGRTGAAAEATSGGGA